jgi:hypothetical protein
MLREWPVCPRPEHDESLPSWIERIGGEYGMSATALANSIDPPFGPRPRWPAPPNLQRLYESHFVDRLVTLSCLSPLERTALWPPMTGWEQQDFTFRAYCPLCCLEDIRAGRTPYGRQCWLQSWCTVCLSHGFPLVMRKPRPLSGFEIPWSAAKLRIEIQYCTPDRYRGLKVARESEVRRIILGSLLQIQRTIASALAGNSPNRLLWGNLSAGEFLAVLDDVTTWSLTHFESVTAWSGAEELTPAEEQEGYGLIGRLRRQCGSERKSSAHRTLRDASHPKVRGAALWAAHALLASCHPDASDRSSGSTPQDRQCARILRSAPVGREWLADRQESWPSTYRRQWWIDLRRSSSTAVAAHNIAVDTNC